MLKAHSALVLAAIALCAGLLGASAALGQSASTGLLRGTPTIVAHKPTIEGPPQNFAIAQSRRGVVYMANDAGLLEFDGARWKLIEMPNKEFVRSLRTCPDGTVYVGGYNLFGRLLTSATGATRFEDLTTPFAEQIGQRQIADIWDIACAAEGVYFRALEDLFFLPTGAGKPMHWSHPRRFGYIFHHKGRTIAQFREQGLKVRRGEGWELLQSTTTLAKLINFLIPLADGSLLSSSIDGRWLRLMPDDTVKTAVMPEGMPPSSRFQSGITLSNGQLALASDEGELWLLESDLKSVRRVMIDQGFLPAVLEDQQGGLLVPADRQFHRVNWPADWTLLGLREGLRGSISALTEWNGKQFLSSSRGLDEMLSKSDGTVELRRTPWANRGALALHPLDKRRALLAENHHLLIIEDGVPRTLHASAYARGFTPSRHVPTRIYVATEDGLMVLEGERFEAQPIDQVKQSMLIGSVEEINADHLLVGTSRFGAWSFIRAPSGVWKAQRISNPALGPADETGPAARTESFSTQGRHYISSSRGLYRYDPKTRTVETASLPGLSERLGKDEVIAFYTSEHPAHRGKRWAISANRIFRETAPDTWRVDDIRGYKHGQLEQVYFARNGQTLLTTTSGLLVFEDRAGAAAARPSPLALRKASYSIGGSSTDLVLSASQAMPQRLSHAPSSTLRFEFSLADFSSSQEVRYRGQLVGLESELSEWSSSAGYFYYDLAPGPYVMKVQALDSRGNITEMEEFHLLIEPRAWAAPWALGAYTLLALALLGLGVWRYTRRRTALLEKRNLVLERKVQERTAELAAANDKLRDQANADGLTGLANRRRFDQFAQALVAQESSYALLMIDADHFKSFNDSQGHLEGDRVLKELGQCLSSALALRHPDALLARYGGEEFVAALPGTALNEAREAAIAIHRTVQEARLGVTVSVGVAARAASLEETIRQADQALYEAKHAGRNCVKP